MKELDVPQSDTIKSAFLCNNLKSFITEYICLLSFPLNKTKSNINILFGFKSLQTSLLYEGMLSKSFAKIIFELERF
ncbi:hypothetical protein DF185_05055 [Marinifilum breve]|uniref:Uncharacterized protein n=1 Tax=Marinifilum breve TaxID=2184082 RepID=A0A2V4A031_9BACT|nr:hypothetical protein DF185_05055 [Marinifilum breve]